MSWPSIPPPPRHDRGELDLSGQGSAGAAASAPTPWGPGQVALGVVALLLTTVVEALVVSGFDPSLDSLAARLSLQAMLAATLIGIAFVASARGGGVSAPDALGLRRPVGSYVKTAAIAYALYIGFALVYSPLVQPHQEDVTRDLGFHESVFGAVAAGLLIIVAAPVSEEIFFRGFMFGGLRNRLPFVVAGPLSGAIFGLFHFTGAGSWAVLPQLAFLGLALAWVYERTGSIYPTICMHALNNALAFAILTS